MLSELGRGSLAGRKGRQTRFRQGCHYAPLPSKAPRFRQEGLDPYRPW